MTTSTEERHLRRLARLLDGGEFTLVLMVHEDAGERDRIAQWITDEVGGEIVRIGPEDTPSTTVLLERATADLNGNDPPGAVSAGCTAGSNTRHLTC